MAGSISVVLCTYNGAEYIEAQLQSIEQQTMPPEEIIVYDDGSQDSTFLIVQAFAALSGAAVKACQNQVRTGVIKNFSQAIAAASGSYIALCDQDDVWLAEKLEKSMAVMDSLEACYGRDVPLLVHSDLKVVNAKLKEISPSMFDLQNLRNEAVAPLKVLLVQNYVTGCTILMNRAAKELVLPLPEDIVMHDWWIALCVAAAGKIGFVDQPLLLYRQHGKNTVGARQYFSLDSLKKVLGVKALLQSLQMTVRQALCLQAHKQKLPQSSRQLLEQYLQYWAAGNIKKIFFLGIHKQGYIRNSCFYMALWLLFWQRLKK